jgi:single-strand DNA-binding protein
MSLNKVILVGRVTRDPELRYTPNGRPVASFGLAVDRNTKNASGEKETDFIDIVVWQQTAEFAAKYATKGRLVAIDGRLQVRNYETQDGQKRRAYEVVANDLRLLDRGKDHAGGGGGGFEGGSGQHYDNAPRETVYSGAAPSGGGASAPADMGLDDIPF